MNSSKRIFIFVWLSLLPFVVRASCYEKTRSAEDNYATCRQAAGQGDAMAQFFLGQMYRNGQGVEKNLQEAVNWYREAASRNNRLAQYNLGWLYDTGEGVAQNSEEAMAWYAKAARLGDPYAPFNIGAAYYRGRDVPRNPENALFWFEVAIVNGNEKARKWRAKIAEHLSPEQLENVQRRLQDWVSEKPEK